MPESPGLRWRWRGAVAPLVLYVCLLFPLSWLSQKLPGDPAGGMLLPADPAARVLAFFQLCIVSAVVEELVFRGAIQGLLAPCGPGFSVLGQAAIFASLHGSPARMAWLAAGMPRRDPLPAQAPRKAGGRQGRRAQQVSMGAAAVGLPR